MQKKKKILCFDAGDEKIFTRAADIFFYQFSGDILFPSSVSFAFFILVFFCCFLKLKMYILIHIRLRGRVSEKKIFPGEFPETIGLLFWPNLKPLSSHTYKKSSSVSCDSFSKPRYLAIHALSFERC